MLVAGLVFVALAAALHVYIFVMESLTWTSEGTRKRFGTTVDEAATTKVLAFNQGFYNLFLAIVTAVGIAAIIMGHTAVGAALVFAGIVSMAAAALVSVTSSPDKARAALVQGVFPVIGIVLLVIGFQMIRRRAPAVLAMIAFGLIGCTESTAAPTESTVSAAPATPGDAAAPAGAQPQLASDPAQLGDDLVADEQALRDPSTPEDVFSAAARRQQVAYRAIGRHPEWDAVIRPRIPPALAEVYDRNVDARRQLAAMAPVRDTVPAWRIKPPAPADELLGYYHEADAALGVGWNYLAAINLIETGLGRIDGISTAGAQGPMQFMPATFAAYGEGAIFIRLATASWRPVAISPRMALPATVIARSTSTTMPTRTCRRLTTTRRCSPPTRPPSRATTGGTSTTRRQSATCCSQSDTPRTRRLWLGTTSRHTRSEREQRKARGARDTPGLSCLWCYSKPSSCRSVMYLTMTSAVMCGMSLSRPIFAS